MVKQSTKSLMLTVLAVVMAISLAFGIFSFSTQSVNAATTYVSAVGDTAVEYDFINTYKKTKFGSPSSNAVGTCRDSNNGILFTVVSVGNGLGDNSKGLKFGSSSSNGGVFQFYIDKKAKIEITFQPNNSSKTYNLYHSTTQTDISSGNYNSTSDFGTSKASITPSTVQTTLTLDGADAGYYTFGHVCFYLVSLKITPAQTTPSTYTVTVTDDGEEVASQSDITAGSKYTLPDAPEAKEYHTFKGWSDGENTYDAGAEVTVNSDLNFEAVWEIDSYKVTFVENEGEDVSDQDVDHGDYATAPTTTKEGYKLLFWTTDSNANEDSAKFDFENTQITGNITLYAVWKQVNTYSVTYAYGNGTANKVIAKVNEGSYTLEAAPERTNYIFLGWNNGTATYDAGATYTLGADVTFTAQWQKVAEVASLSYAYSKANHDKNWTSDANKFITAYNIEYSINSSIVVSDNDHSVTKSMFKINAGTSDTYEKAITIVIPQNVTGGYIKVSGAGFSTTKNADIVITSPTGAKATANTNSYGLTGTGTNKPYAEQTGVECVLDITSGGTYYIGAVSKNNSNSTTYITSIEVSAKAGVDYSVNVNGESIDVVEGTALANLNLKNVAPEGYELVGFMNANQEVLANDTAVENGAEYTAIYGKTSVVDGASILLSTQSTEMGIRFGGQFEVYNEGFAASKVIKAFSLSFEITLELEGVGSVTKEFTADKFDESILTSTIKFNVTIKGEAGDMATKAITATVNGTSVTKIAQEVAEDYIEWCASQGKPLNSNQLSALKTAYAIAD